MTDVLAGVKVVEVTQFAYVPAAGATLADWGADVVKVVHPVDGDVMHSAHAAGLAPLPDGTAYMWEVANRNKRSIGVDLAMAEGREVLYDMVKGADVFLTNLLAPSRRRLGIDLADVRGVNREIVYARGSGQGPAGPDAEAGGYDNVSFWARSGWANPLAVSAGRFMYQPAPGCGDLTAGFALAGGIAAALYKRERTGETSVVDGSLLASGVWGMAGSVAASDLYGMPTIPIREKDQAGNALTHGYRTRDGRWILLSGIVHEQGFAELADRVGCPGWVDDPRFSTHEARVAHHSEFVQALDAAFAERTLDEWRRVLPGMALAFGVVQDTSEVAADPQCVANGYVQDVVTPAGRTLKLASTPVQFDEAAPSLRAAPEPGGQTEDILLELGRTWDDIARLKSLRAVS